MNNTFIKTDNQVKLDLNANLNNPNANSNQLENLNLTNPRYGTTVDLKTNKVVNVTDKHLTRDKLINSNKKYRITRINVDSRYRNTDPQNIISNTIKTSNPFQFTANSNILYIKMPTNHGLSVDNFITISNIQPINTILRATSLTFKQNSNIMYINHPNHGFQGTNNIIQISGVINSDPLNYFINNIPISIINSKHTVSLITKDNTVDPNNYTIQLDIYSEVDYTYTENNFNVQTLTYNGVNIKYINSSYPITNDIQQGYQIVYESGINYIKVQLSVSATYSTPVNTFIGNNDICIGQITSTINGYANPDYYIFNFKTHYKVKKIKLVSTEFPNTQMLINSMPSNLQNNVFYWQIREDGDYIYSIEIHPGNYDTISLANELTSKINATPRKFGSYLNKDLYNTNCISNIIINPNNNLFSIQISSLITLSKNIMISTETFSDDSKRVIVTHPFHNLNVGDTITISGVIYLMDINNDNTITYYIPDNIINNTFAIDSVIGINNYLIKLPKYNPIIENNNNNRSYAGGNAIIIKFSVTIRLLFNYSNTFGSVLGFNNVGESSSITIYNKIITNNTLYYDATNINSVGMVNYNSPILNFTTYPYILMVSDIFNSTVNYKTSDGVFAKLFLTGNPGSMIYDQYVQINEDISTTISYLSELSFSFLTPDGKPYNFNGQNHSYTIELYELLDTIINQPISSFTV